MHFCNICDNMYYLKIQEDNPNTLIYYCRHCGNEDSKLNKDNICVSKTQIRRNKEKYIHVINEYTKLDPTLPRIKTIRCPNQACLSNSDKAENEVLYIRYDDTNIKYIYMCTHCDTTWKTGNQS